MVTKTAIATDPGGTRQGCPGCGSTKLQKAGRVMLRSGMRQRVKCTKCGRVFYEEEKVSDKT